MKKIKILHISTHNENCGIGRYQEKFVEYMGSIDTVHNEFFKYSPNKMKNMSSAQFAQALDEFKEVAQDFDIIHIQHEYSFFHHTELKQFIDAGKSLNKKVIVTVHTAFASAHKHPKLTGVGPRSIALYARAIRRGIRLRNRFVKPLNNADLILVPNQLTKEDQIQTGVDESIITVLTHPVPEFKPLQSKRLRTTLKIQKGDILLATVGYISDKKGVLDAVKAMLLLPDHYKLAIIGGVHPEGSDDKYLNRVSDVIINHNLQSRVYITGYIDGDETKNAFVQEADICLYPYDKTYYARVSSAALGDALANHKPVVAYPTLAFQETNANTGLITLAGAFSYYELARAVEMVDTTKAATLAKQFAQNNSYPIKAQELVQIYETLIAD